METKKTGDILASFFCSIRLDLLVFVLFNHRFLAVVF